MKRVAKAQPVRGENLEGSYKDAASGCAPHPLRGAQPRGKLHIPKLVMDQARKGSCKDLASNEKDFYGVLKRWYAKMEQTQLVICNRFTWQATKTWL